jgi:RND family efflux transporter MFP subunit
MNLRMLYYCLPLLMVISYGCDTTASEDLPAGTTEVTHTHEGGEEHTHLVGSEDQPSLGVTVWTDKFELYMEHPPLRAEIPVNFAIHLTELEGSKPVTEGPVLVRFMKGQELVKLLTMGNPEVPGLFVPEVIFDTPDQLKMIVEVMNDSLEGEIVVESLTVHDVSTDPAQLLVQEETDGDVIAYLKEQQWVLPFATTRVETRSLMRSVQAAGEVIAKSSHSTLVFPPIGGLLIEPPSGIPLLGGRVERGQLLGWIVPPPDAQSSIGSNQVQTGLALVELKTLIATSEASLAAERSRLELARRGLARVERLFEMEAVPQYRLEESRSEVEIREAALRAAEEIQENLEEAEELIQGQGQSVQQLGTRIPLEAPISGTIVDINAVSGAFVEAQQVLYQIADLSEVWVRGEVYESDIAHITPRSGATVRLSGRQNALELQSSRLVAIGEVVDPETRTIPVIWEVSNPRRELKIGMLTRLDIGTGQNLETLAVPESAVFLEENKDVVYVQVGGESFVRRIVTTGIEDRGWIEILDGLEAGERIVVVGGYEIALVSRSVEGAAAHGHVH